jgi:ArsR family transcriptional regulator
MGLGVMPIIKTLKALADDNRLKILHMLLDNDLCVGALAMQLGISKPAVSQHLQILRRAGLVKGEKRGYWTHYIVEREALSQAASEISDLAMKEKTNNTICWRIGDAYGNKTKTEEVDMCQNCCQQPNKLMDKPENCTPEQIRECHGDTGQHPCTKENSASDHKQPTSDPV